MKGREDGQTDKDKHSIGIQEKKAAEEEASTAPIPEKVSVRCLVAKRSCANL